MNPPIGAKMQFFGEGSPQSLDYGALHLATCCIRVQDAARVLSTDQSQHVNLACVQVYLHVRPLTTESPTGSQVALPCSRVRECEPLRHKGATSHNRRVEGRAIWPTVASG